MGQRLKKMAKFCLNWMFFMMTSIVLLNTQMHNIKLGSSKLIIKSDTQKHMVEFGFERVFHDLEYF